MSGFKGRREKEKKGSQSEFERLLLLLVSKETSVVYSEQTVKEKEAGNRLTQRVGDNLHQK